jgi:hypothetical protein
MHSTLLKLVIRYGRVPPCYQRPLLFYHDGKIILNFMRSVLIGRECAPRTEGIPCLSTAQAEALDAVHFLAKKHQLVTRMFPGDIRFINNLALLHCRESYEDSDTTRRHLIRLWLRNDRLAWALPPELQQSWDLVFDDDPDKHKRWELQPIPMVAPPLFRQPT